MTRVILLLFLVAAASCIPSFESTSSDTFKIYYLRAPLFKQLVGDAMTYFDAYHFGVGFVNTRTGNEFAVDFSSYPGVEDSMLPSVDFDNEIVTWKDTSDLRFHDKIDRNYWLSDGIIELYEIDGNGVRQYFDYFYKGYNETILRYKMFQVFKDGKLVFDSFNCVDFIVQSLEFISSLGARKTSDVDTVGIDSIRFYISSMAPTPLEADSKEIFSFYKTYYGLFQKFLGSGVSVEELEERKEKYKTIGLEKVIRQTAEEIQKVKDKFVYQHMGEYYEVEISPPYASFEFIQWTIPDFDEESDEL